MRKIIIGIFVVLIAICHAADESEIKEKFVHAYSYFQDQEYDKALIALNQFLIDFPESEFGDEATFLVGESLLSKGQTDLAIAKFESLLKNYQDDRLFDDALFRLGDTYFRSGNLEKAKSTFENFLQKYPETRWTIDAYYWLAETDYALKNFASAVRSYREVLDRDATFQYADFAHYSLGCALIEIAKFDEAETVFDQLLKNFSETSLRSEAIIKYGQTLSQIGKHQQAIDQLGPLTKTSSEASFWISNSYIELNQFQQAISALDSFFKNPITEFLPLAHFKNAISNLKIKNYDTAKRSFQNAIQNLPKDQTAEKAFGMKADRFAYTLAQLLDADGKTKNAIAEYTDLIENYQKSDQINEARFRVGLWHAQQKNHKKARSFLQSIAKSKTDLADRALFAIGNGHYENSEIDLAIENYQNLIDDFPNSQLRSEAQFWLGLSHFQKSDFSSAVSVLRSVIDGKISKTEQATANYKIGEAEYQLKNYRSSITAFSSAIAIKTLKKSDVALAYFWIGESHYNLDQHRQAITEFQNAIDQKPSKELTSSIHYRIGCAFDALGDRDKADQAFVLSDQTSTENSSSDAATATFRLAQSLQRRGKAPQAVAKFRSFLDRNPDHDLSRLANYHIGQCFYRQQKFASAIEAFKIFINAKTKVDQAIIESAHIELGNSHFNNGSFTNAIRTYQKLIQKFPKSDLIPSAYFWIGNAEMKRDRLDQAFSAFDASQQRGDQFREQSLYQMAEIRHSQNNHAAAIENYRKVTAINDKSSLNENSYFRIGDGYFAISDYSAAADAYKTAIQKFPKSDLAIRGTYYKGVSHQTIGEHDHAISAFRIVVKSSSADFSENAQYRIGKLFYADQEFYESITEFEKAIKNFPKSDLAAEAQYIIAVSHYHLDQFSEAISAYKKEIQNYRDEDLARKSRYELCTVYHEMNDVPNAISACEAFLKSHPKDPLSPELQYRIGEYEFDRDNFDLAISAYENVLANYATSDQADDSQFSIGLSHGQKEDYNKAIEAFDQLLKNFPKSSLHDNAYFQKGLALMNQKNYREAIDHLDAMPTIYKSPLLAKGLYHVGLSFESLAEPENAVKAYQSLIDTYPQSDQKPNANFRIGLYHHGQQKYSEAIDRFRKVLDSEQLDLHAETEFRLADCYFKTEKYDLAKSLYQKVQSRNADQKWVIEAKVRLNWIDQNGK